MYSFFSTLDVKSFFLLFVIGSLIFGLGIFDNAFAQIEYLPPIIIPSPPQIAPFFGTSLDIDGNYILIGDFRAKENSVNTGIAYLYDTSGELQLTFKSPVLQEDDYFGFSVDIDGNNVLIGAPNDDTNFTDAGAAYLYDITETAPGEFACDGDEDEVCETPFPFTAGQDAEAGAEFGISVAIDANNILIGAHKQDLGSSPEANHGKAYLFDTSGNLQLTFEEGSTSYIRSLFGNSVDIDGNNVLIGAPSDVFGSIEEAGDAFLYDITETAPGEFACDDDGDGICRTPDHFTLSVGEDKFGKVVAIDGNNILIGANKNNQGGSRGTVFLYDTSGALQLKFTNTFPAGNNFGASIDISGNNVLIGLTLDRFVSFLDLDAAYLYDITETAPGEFACDGDDGSVDGVCETLISFASDQDPENDVGFGHSVAIDGNNVTIGEYSNKVAYLFLENINSAPLVTVSSNVVSPTDISPIPFTATFDEPVTGLTEGKIAVTNGSVEIGSLTPQDDIPTFTYDFTVTPDADGPVTVQISADAAQNVPEGIDNIVSNIETVIFDSIYVSIDSPVDGSATNDRQPTFSGTTEPNASVEVSISGTVTQFGSTTADDQGNWIIPWTDPNFFLGLLGEEIQFTIDATATDGVNTDTDTITFTIDTKPPVVTLSSNVASIVN